MAVRPSRPRILLFPQALDRLRSNRPAAFAMGAFHFLVARLRRDYRNFELKVLRGLR